MERKLFKCTCSVSDFQKLKVIVLNYEGVSFEPKHQVTHWLLGIENIITWFIKLHLGWNDLSSNNLVFLYISGKFQLYVLF